MTAQVLIVDDEIEHAIVMADALRKPGHICTVRNSLETAMVELQGGQFDVIVTDLIMQGEPAGMKVLEEARRLQPMANTLMVTAHGDIPTAKQALRMGAYDFIEKPLDLEVFRNLVNRAAEAVMLKQQNENLRTQLDDKYGYEGIIGSSAQIRQVISIIQQIGPTDIPVLISGETGTGKELIAHALHNASHRKTNNFKPVNCAAFNESLLESQLFGHIKGAFTGADKPAEGVFEYASGGTLFLDEIGDMPLGMQSKLLRVLESGEVVRVGANESKTVDVRLISATHRNINEMVNNGEFRQDLFYRVKGVEINLPALRDRREDIPLLVNHTIEQVRKQTINGSSTGKSIAGINDEVMRLLIGFDWPGNVRQLLTVIRNMVVFCKDGQTLSMEYLPSEIRLGHSAGSSATGEINSSSNTVVPGSLAGVDLAELEKRAIRETLKMTQGNREQAAALLGIGERTLYRKLKEFGLR